jgi:hypothetical protein
MKRRPSFALLVALVASLLVALSGPLVARADSQAGGLPAVADRVSALEAAVTSLQIANTNLKNALNAETAARTAGDSALQAANTSVQNALNAEIAARSAGDSALQAANANLQSALNAEIAARSAGDSALQAAIGQEAAARQSADSALSAALSTAKGKAFSTFVPNFGLVNGAEAVVATLGPLPPGDYFVIARATVRNASHDAAWYCFLELDNIVPLDDVREGTEEFGLFEGAAFATSYGNLTNIRVTTALAPSGTVRMKCSTHVAGSDLLGIRIIAIELGGRTDLPSL